MNICFISNEYPSEDCGGGIGTYTYRIARCLGQMGHRVWVICRSGSEKDPDIITCGENVTVYPVKNKRIRLPVLARLFRVSYDRISRALAVYDKVREILFRDKIDIIETPNFCAEGLFCLKLRSTPMVVRFYTSMAKLVELGAVRPNLDIKIACWFEKILSRRAVKCIALTNAVKEDYSEKYNIDKRKIAVIHLGTKIPDNNIDIFQRGMILFVGKLDFRKGIGYLLKAVPEVLAAIPHAEVVLIGEDVGYRQDRLSVRDYIDKKYAPEIRARVKKMGFLDRKIINEYYQKCDIFVAPSVYESFGLIFIEAMSYGKPVVAFDVAGTSEIIKDNHTGLLVKAGDVDGLVRAMVSLLKDTSLRNELACNSRVWVGKKFSTAKMAEEALNLYGSVLNGQYEIEA